MKRPVKVLLVVFIFMITLSASLWYFFPWEDAGVLAASRLRQQLNRKGVASGWREVTSTGNFPPSIRLNSFVISSFAGGIAFPYIQVRPLICSSILRGGAVLNVAFPQSLLKFSIGEMEDMEVEGTVVLTVKGKNVELKDLFIEGDIEASGDFSIDRSSGRIVESNLNIMVPEKTETLMYSLNSFLPLKRNSPGKWEMVRVGGE